EGVGDRTLKELLGGAAERCIGREVRVERLQSGEKARDVGLPVLRRAVVPGFLALRYRRRPVEQVADVRENLARRARTLLRAEVREPCGRAAHRLPSTIGKRGERVAQQFPIWHRACGSQFLRGSRAKSGGDYATRQQAKVHREGKASGRAH